MICSHSPSSIHHFGISKCLLNNRIELWMYRTFLKRDSSCSSCILFELVKVIFKWHLFKKTKARDISVWWSACKRRTWKRNYSRKLASSSMKVSYSINHHSLVIVIKRLYHSVIYYSLCLIASSWFFRLKLLQNHPFVIEDDKLEDGRFHAPRWHSKR